MEFAAAELEAVQSRLLSLEAEKNSLAARLEANRQEAASSNEVRQTGLQTCRLAAGMSRDTTGQRHACLAGTLHRVV